MAAARYNGKNDGFWHSINWCRPIADNLALTSDDRPAQNILGFDASSFYPRADGRQLACSNEDFTTTRGVQLRIVESPRVARARRELRLRSVA